MHFVEVGFLLVLICMAGIGNAGPVLAELQRICWRLLVLTVEMEILFWQFASSLLETLHFLMEIQGTPHKGVSCFCISFRETCVHVLFYFLIRK